jgi:ribosomal protein S27AE
MKILVEGKIDKLKEAKFECPRCGCVFISNEMEYCVIGKFGDDYILEHECPCCGINIQVYDKRQHLW